MTIAGGILRAHYAREAQRIHEAQHRYIATVVLAQAACGSIMSHTLYGTPLKGVRRVTSSDTIPADVKGKLLSAAAKMAPPDQMDPWQADTFKCMAILDSKGKVVGYATAAIIYVPGDAMPNGKPHVKSVSYAAFDLAGNPLTK